jgi:hypothetical protein
MSAKASVCWITVNAFFSVLLAFVHKQTVSTSGPGVVSKKSFTITPIQNASLKTQWSSSSGDASPFNAIYSADTDAFVRNLRNVNCPEDTIKDIVTLEIANRFAGKRSYFPVNSYNAEKVKWSTRAATKAILGQELEQFFLNQAKYNALTQSLGYSVEFPSPTGPIGQSMSAIEDQLQGLPEAQRQCAASANIHYWEQVRNLLEMTCGFWTSADVMMLEEMKEKRRRMIQDCLK